MEQINLNYKMYLLYYDHTKWFGTSNHFVVLHLHQMYRDNPTSWCHQSWGWFCDKLLAIMIGLIALTGLGVIGVMNSIGYMGIGPILIISTAFMYWVVMQLLWFIAIT